MNSLEDLEYLEKDNTYCHFLITYNYLIPGSYYKFFSIFFTYFDYHFSGNQSSMNSAVYTPTDMFLTP